MDHLIFLTVTMDVGKIKVKWSIIFRAEKFHKSSFYIHFLDSLRKGLVHKKGSAAMRKQQLDIAINK